MPAPQPIPGSEDFSGRGRSKVRVCSLARCSPPLGLTHAQRPTTTRRRQPSTRQPLASARPSSPDWPSTGLLAPERAERALSQSAHQQLCPETSPGLPLPVRARAAGPGARRVPPVVDWSSAQSHSLGIPGPVSPTRRCHRPARPSTRIAIVAYGLGDGRPQFGDRVASLPENRGSSSQLSPEDEDTGLPDRPCISAGLSDNFRLPQGPARSVWNHLRSQMMTLCNV